MKLSSWGVMRYRLNSYPSYLPKPFQVANQMNPLLSCVMLLTFRWATPLSDENSCIWHTDCAWTGNDNIQMDRYIRILEQMVFMSNSVGF